MKKMYLVAASIFCLMALPVVSYALPTPGAYDTLNFGTQIGDVYDIGAQGDDAVTAFVLTTLRDANYLTQDCDLEIYSKLDIDEDGLSNTSITIAYYPEETGHPSGTFGGWETVAAINFWLVKAGTEFTLWTYGTPGMPDPVDEGYWTTAGLVSNQGKPLEISHFTAFNPDCNPVPEPATMLLFGTGLAGLAGMIRRKKEK
jgi:hypothetical protein